MSLSLVAYGSSDENSDSGTEDNDNIDSSVNSTVEQSSSALPNKTDIVKTKNSSLSGNNANISDEENDILVSINDVDDLSSGLNLPPTKHHPTPVNSHNTNRNTNSELDNASVLGLPAPKPVDRNKTTVQTLTEDDELEEMVKPKAAELAQRAQPPKKKKVIKISVPTLSNFDSDEEDEPVQKKLKPSSGGSGLFALLPQPKHVSIKEAGRSLLPHTLTRKPAAASRPASKPAKPSTANLPKSDGVGITEPVDSDDEEESSKSGNFFSIGDSSQEGAFLSASAFAVTSSLSTLPPVKRQKSQTDTSSTLVNEMPSSSVENNSGCSVADIPLPLKSTTSMFVGPTGPTTQEQATAYPQMLEPVNNEDYNMAGVDEMYPNETENDMEIGVPPEELLKLQGKRKWGKEEIKIIDVHADHQTSTVELTKHITEEVDMVSHSKKKKDQPTTQQKRKHQITYLAHMAKEREFDLKNQWAQNKMTKRQSQSKYGF